MKNIAILLILLFSISSNAQEEELHFDTKLVYTEQDYESDYDYFNNEGKVTFYLNALKNQNDLILDPEEFSTYYLLFEKDSILPLQYDIELNRWKASWTYYVNTKSSLKYVNSRRFEKGELTSKGIETIHNHKCHSYVISSEFVDTNFCIDENSKIDNAYYIIPKDFGIKGKLIQFDYYGVQYILNDEQPIQIAQKINYKEDLQQFHALLKNREAETGMSFEQWYQDLFNNDESCDSKEEYNDPLPSICSEIFSVLQEYPEITYDSKIYNALMNFNYRFCFNYYMSYTQESIFPLQNFKEYSADEVMLFQNILRKHSSLSKQEIDMTMEIIQKALNRGEVKDLEKILF